MFSPLVNPPLYVVTCSTRDERSGCLVEFATQCSMQPPRFLVCLSIVNHTYKVANNTTALAVHLLAEDKHELASLFGGKTGDEVDKFAGVSWRSGKTGAPILTDCPTFFEGLIVQKVPFGDHVGFVLDPIDEVDAKAAIGDEQLTLKDVNDLTPGHPIEAAAKE